MTVTQRLTDHLPVSMRKGTRELLWKVRAKRVILATGAHERPIVFGNNDLPGVMLAGAVSTYVHRFGVLPGHNAVVFTNNDRAYQTALDLKACGAKVTVVDSRASSNGALPAAAKRQGVTVMSGAVVTGASGKWRVSSVDVASYSNGQTGGKLQTLPCDLVAMSGGFSPVLHLFAQSGGKACWNDEKACFLPGKPVQAEASIGAAAGESVRRARCGSRSMRAWKPRRQRVSPLRSARSRRRSRKPSKAHCSRCGWSAAAKPRHAGRSSSSTSRTTCRPRTSCWPHAKASSRSST